MVDCKFKVAAYRRELRSNKFLLTSRSDIPRVKDANRETYDNNGYRARIQWQRSAVYSCFYYILRRSSYMDPSLAGKLYAILNSYR